MAQTNEGRQVDVSEGVTDGSNTVPSNAEGHRSGSRRFEQVTPLASFSPDELSDLRHTSPDIYQALLQYEQLCRHSSAVVQAKETELQRCIDVGQEVLGQIDVLQLRCAQLAKERDDAVAKSRECESHLRENIAELQRLLSDREEEISSLKANKRVFEAEGRRSQVKVSAIGLPAAAQVVVLHNQLLELIERTEQACNTRRSSSSSMASAARMSVASIPTNGDDSDAGAALEQWLADSLDQVIHRSNDLTGAIHLLDELLQRTKEQLEQSTRKCRESESRISTLQEENEQLQRAFFALQEEVQALDKHTEELKAPDLRTHAGMEEFKQNELEGERRQHAEQLQLVRDQYNEEKRVMEEELQLLRTEAERSCDGDALSEAGNKPPHQPIIQLPEDHKQKLQDIVNDFESEKRRLGGVIEQLEHALFEGKTSYQRLVAQYEEELQQQQVRSAELVRTAVENSRLREQLEHANASASVVGELTKALETKEMYIATLNQQVRQLGMEVAKQRDEERLTEKQGTRHTATLKNYDDMEMELRQERENSQQLGASLAAVRSQLDELTVLFSEQKRRVQECLRCPPPQPGVDRERILSLLHASATRAASRFFNCLEQQHQHLSSLSHYFSTVYGGTEPTPGQGGATTLREQCFQAAHCSAATSSLPVASNGVKNHHECQRAQPEQIQRNASRFASATASPLFDNECAFPRSIVFRNSETAAALSTAMVRFLSDLSEALVQQLLQPYVRPLEALQQLQSAFNPLTGVTNEQWPQRGKLPIDASVLKSVSFDNIELSVDENMSMMRFPVSKGQQERVSSDDVIWGTVNEGIIDAFVDACTAVFQRVYRAAGSQLQQCEEKLKEANRQVYVKCDERIRRAAACMAEGEGSLNAQLQAAQAKARSAYQAVDMLQGKYEKEASRCMELTARVTRLEGRLADKQRELETERLQWRNTVRELQDACGASKQQQVELGTRHQHQVKELQELLSNVRQQLQAARDEGHRLRLEVESVQAEQQQKIQWLEQEQQKTRSSEGKAEHVLQTLREQLAASNAALQVKLNEETVRVQRANANVESLQSVLRDAQSAYQLLQSALSDEQDRREMAEERVEGLNRELALLRSRLHVQQQRVAELQEAERLQQCQLDAEARKNEALLRVNRALEGRLSEVEGDREPLRQQLQSLLLLKHC